MKKLLPLLFFLLNVSANAQDGALDLSFGTSGVAKKNLNPPKGATTLNATDISKIVVQNDGKILQVGYKGSSTGDDFVIIRYNYDGSPDASFGTQAGGWTVTDINGKDDRAHGVAIQNDGKIIIAGETIIGVKTAFAVARYNPDGKTLDNTFGTNGLVVDLNSNPSGANSVTMQPDGKILVAGWGKENTTNDFVVTRYNTDGSFDNSFDTDGKLFTDFASGNDAATDIHFLNDGTNRILVAGYETNGPNTYFALAMYNNDGTLNAAFNGGKVVSTFTGSGRSVDIAADGKVYVTGLSNSTGNYDYTTESFNPDGTLNTFFNGSGIVKTNLGSVSDASRSVKLQCDGKILVGGEFNDPATSRYSYAVVRYNPDGSLDNSFNGNGKSIVNTGGSNNDYDYGFCGLALQDGKILMGGVSFPPPVSLAGRIYFNPTIIRLQNNTATAGNITPATASICNGGSQLLTTSGGTSYQWSLNGSPLAGETTSTYSATAAGTYSVVITNGTCSGPASNTSTVTVASAPAGNINPATASICSGGSQLLTTSGGTSYQWSLNGSPIPGETTSTYSATAAGTYSVVITNGTCSGPSSNTSTVTIASAPVGNISPSTASICSGGSQLLTTSGGTSYQWNLNGSPLAGETASTYTATAAGIYSVVITNGTCSGPASNTATVTISSAPAGNITPSTASICAGGSHLLTTSGGTSYQWSLNGSSIAGATSSTYNANTAGTYSVVITNGTCSGPASNTSTINISNSQAVEITALGSTEICEGKSVSIVANINGTYQWYKNGVPLANTDQKIYIANEAGKYMVIVKAAANCTSSSNEIDVTKIPPPKGSITSASDILCEGNSMILYVTGGSSYQWFENGFPVTGATTSSYSAEMPGVYSALIMNDKGCEAETSNTLILKMVQKPTADFTFDLSCQKQANHFTNTSTYENSGTIKWQWDFGDLSTADSFSVSHIFADSGKYFVTLTAVPVACPQLSSGIKKEVNIIAGIPGIKYLPVRVIKNVAYPLTARNIGQKYLWQPAAGLNDPFTRTPFVTASKEITYTIKINMENGCSTVDTLLVQVFDKTEVFVPRAFTPNANNANDVLRPIVVNIPRINFFKVFNRWGQLVFQTQKTGEGWDGKYKGSVQPTETYTWVFEGTDINGNIIKSNGQTILIR